ncbi:MAG: hypothetical protein EPN38_04825 [Rhodanobacteraceae bacterium]|nr:MAG: hypothetical protein EPN38_04825 [Rhodanobacteraceae bacterium]
MTSNSFGTRDRLDVGDTAYGIHRLDRADGALPLQFPEGQNAGSLGLSRGETFAVTSLEGHKEVPATVRVKAIGRQGQTRKLEARARVDTPVKGTYRQHGGILQCILRQLLAGAPQ